MFKRPETLLEKALYWVGSSAAAFMISCGGDEETNPFDCPQDPSADCQDFHGLYRITNYGEFLDCLGADAGWVEGDEVSIVMYPDCGIDLSNHGRDVHFDPDAHAETLLDVCQGREYIQGNFLYVPRYDFTLLGCGSNVSLTGPNEITGALCTMRLSLIPGEPYRLRDGQSCEEWWDD